MGGHIRLQQPQLGSSGRGARAELHTRTERRAAVEGGWGGVVALECHEPLVGWEVHAGWAEQLAFELGADPRVVLDPGSVQGSVGEYLAAVGAQEAVPGIGPVSSGVAGDGATVVVRIEASVSLVPPSGGWAAGLFPATVPVSAEGSSRTVLTL